MMIHHIGYLVKNIEKSRKKFTALGFIDECEVQYDGRRDIYIQFLINGDYRVELVQPAGEDSTYMAAMKRFKNLPYHMCFTTSDLDESIDKYKTQQGFILSKEPEIASCLNNKRVAFMQHPVVGIIELLEV